MPHHQALHLTAEVAAITAYSPPVVIFRILRAYPTKERSRFGTYSKWQTRRDQALPAYFERESIQSTARISSIGI
jgi:hypothetical protein